jgi:predicted RNA binding protein YcfA (HicA-like mRNA interferase family)
LSHILILCSGSKAVKKLIKAGWDINRQVGSHVMMTKFNYPYTLSIPQHKELGIGILKKIISQAGLTVEEFNSL